MQIIDFRYITKNDSFDDSYQHWSRKYEYPTVSSRIRDLIGDTSNPKIHNTSWGFDLENHQKFKNALETEYGIFAVTNSDILFRNILNTCIRDITKKPLPEYVNYYDLVLNISALEEIPGNHLDYFDNLMEQVKVGGHLILTFDLPGFQLTEFENKMETKMSSINYSNRIIGTGEPWFAGLSVGLLIIQK